MTKNIRNLGQILGFTLSFCLSISPAFGAWSDWIPFVGSDSCSSGTSGFKSANGKTVLCKAGNGSFIGEISESPGTFHSFIASGRAAENMVENSRNDQIAKVIESTSPFVMPITDQSGKQIFGTAIRHGNVVLTALHVIHQITDQSLFIFDNITNKWLPILGYAPLKRDASNQIDFYEDFALLLIDQDLINASPNLPLISINKNFKYLDLSYPKNKNSIQSPTALMGTTALPQTDENHLVVLNRHGQDFKSSGGGIFDFMTGELKAMDICIEPKSNAVLALNLGLLNEKIELALAKGYLNSLQGIEYHFIYENQCDPIGGRRGGP